MQSKILFRRSLLVAIFIGSTLSLVLLFFIIKFNTHQPTTIQIKNDVVSLVKDVGATSTIELVVPGLPALPVGRPTRLFIPKINVDVDLEHVGITPEGAVDIPKSQNNAAWFSIGPRPGEIGSAIITGHYGWKNREPSAFDDLYKLRVGDKLFVEDDQNATFTFIVRAMRRYDPKAETPEVFEANDGESHLNLITCEGDWDKVSQSYSKRLVVFADKE